MKKTLFILLLFCLSLNLASAKSTKIDFTSITVLSSDWKYIDTKSEKYSFFFINENTKEELTISYRKMPENSREFLRFGNKQQEEYLKKFSDLFLMVRPDIKEYASFRFQNFGESPFIIVDIDLPKEHLMMASIIEYDYDYSFSYRNPRNKNVENFYEILNAFQIRIHYH